MFKQTEERLAPLLGQVSDFGTEYPNSILSKGMVKRLNPFQLSEYLTLRWQVLSRQNMTS